MGAIGVVANADKIRSAHLTQLFVNQEITIGKQGKGNIIGLFKMIDLERRIADTDADEFDLALIPGIAFDFSVDLVDSGSLPLTVGSVHAEHFDDHDGGIDIRYGEILLPLDPEVGLVLRQIRCRQDNFWKYPADCRRLRGGGRCQNRHRK